MRDTGTINLVRRSILAYGAGLASGFESAHARGAGPRVVFCDVDTLGARGAFNRYVEECNSLAPAIARTVQFEFLSTDPEGPDAPRHLRELIQRLAAQNVRLAIATSSVVGRAFASAGPPIDVLFHTVEPRSIAEAAQPSVIGNPRMTGFISSVPLVGKRIEILEQCGIRTFRLGIALDDALREETDELPQVQQECRHRALSLLTFDANELAGFQGNLMQVRDRIDALLVPRLILTVRQGRPLCAIIQSSGLPAIYAQSRLVREGGLISYEAAIEDAAIAFARQTIAILSGIPPARLPIEYPRHFRLAVNLDTARAQGIRIPAQVLKRVDMVVRELSAGS